MKYLTDALNLIIPAAMGSVTVYDFKPIEEGDSLQSPMSKYGLDSIDFFSVTLYLESVFEMDELAVKEYMRTYEGEMNLGFYFEFIEKFWTVKPAIEAIRDLL